VVPRRRRAILPVPPAPPCSAVETRSETRGDGHVALHRRLVRLVPLCDGAFSLGRLFPAALTDLGARPRSRPRFASSSRISKFSNQRTCLTRRTRGDHRSRVSLRCGHALSRGRRARALSRHGPVDFCQYRHPHHERTDSRIPSSKVDRKYLLSPLPVALARPRLCPILVDRRSAPAPRLCRAGGFIRPRLGNLALDRATRAGAPRLCHDATTRPCQRGLLDRFCLDWCHL
jgi:hypothetical protein